MPAFIMPFASSEGEKRFKELETFTQAYVEAMFFTECNPDSEELADATFEDLAPVTLEQIINECDAFQGQHEALLEAAEACEGYDTAQAGHDYWLTRNHHGAGFWDGDLPDALGLKLTRAANADGARDLYKGDDGRLYL